MERDALGKGLRGTPGSRYDVDVTLTPATFLSIAAIS